MLVLPFLRQLLFAAALMCVALPLPTLAAEEPATKAAVPADDVLAATSKTVSDVYKAQLEAAKSPVAKAQLAAKLLQDGMDTTDDAAARYVLYRAARKVASGSGDLDLVLRIVERWSTDFVVDGPGLESEALAELVPFAKTAEDSYVLVRIARRRARAAAAADQYEAAIALAKVALDAARKMKDADVVKQCEAEVKRLTTAAAQYEATRTAAIRLEQTPTDPSANTAVGKYYCFVQGNFDKGLPMLALGDDAALKVLAGRDLQNPQDAPTQIALGDAWYELAQKQDAAVQGGLLSRAGYWYRISPLGASGLSKVRIDKRLAEIDAATSSLRAGEWVELLDFVNLPRDQFRGNWVWRGTSLASTAGQSCQFYLPVIVDGSFDLRLRATCSGKSSLLCLALPFPGHEATLHINAGEPNICGIWRVDGREGHDGNNPARGRAVPTTPGQPFTVEVRVEKKGDQAAVSMAYEGKRCSSWQGPIASLGRWWELNFRPQQIILGSPEEQYQLHSVRFRLINGSARLLD